MSFQPPPPGPPGGSPPPPPPPGQWGPPPAGGAGGFDPKTVNPLDWGIIGAGFLIFIFSFIDYYGASAETSGRCGGFGGSSSSDAGSAWHGFFGWFGVLLAIAGSVLVAMELFAPQVKLPIPNRLAALGLYAVATLSVLLALFIDPVSVPDDQSFGGCTISYSIDHGFGYWVSLILCIAGAVLALMRLQQTGGQLPGNLGSKIPNIGAHGPQGGMGGGQPGPHPGPGPGPGSQPPPPPPPPGGYGPPQ